MNWYAFLSLVPILAMGAALLLCKRRWVDAAFAAGVRRGRASGISYGIQQGILEGRRQTAHELAASDIPSLRIIGEAMIRDGWGKS